VHPEADIAGGNGGGVGADDLVAPGWYTSLLYRAGIRSPSMTQWNAAGSEGVRVGITAGCGERIATTIRCTRSQMASTPQTIPSFSPPLRNYIEFLGIPSGSDSLTPICRRSRP
jgi:hypothetical protein